MESLRIKEFFPLEVMIMHRINRRDFLSVFCSKPSIHRKRNLESNAHNFLLLLFCTMGRHICSQEVDSRWDKGKYDKVFCHISVLSINSWPIVARYFLVRYKALVQFVQLLKVFNTKWFSALQLPSLEREGMGVSSLHWALFFYWFRFIRVGKQSYFCHVAIWQIAIRGIMKICCPVERDFRTLQKFFALSSMRSTAPPFIRLYKSRFSLFRLSFIFRNYNGSWE
jgi:hypothetical protein